VEIRLKLFIDYPDELPPLHLQTLPGPTLLAQLAIIYMRSRCEFFFGNDSTHLTWGSR